MPAGSLTARKLRVLLIEDNADDALLIARHLRQNGFAPEVVQAETSAEMIFALGQTPPPDVILADYNLPEFSGPEALAILRSRGLDIPFIMLSGAVTEETAVASLRAGAQDYVSKQNLTRLVPALERELVEFAGRRRERAAQEALRTSESRFHRLVEAMPLGLLLLDSEGRIVYANRAMETMLGYPPGSFHPAAVTLASVFPAGLAQRFAAGDVPGKSELFETACVTRGGDSIEALVGVAQLDLDTSAARQTAIFIADLTLQKKSEETLRRAEKLAVAGRLAASIAHEINNPLAAVTNCLYLAEQTVLPEDARSYLDTAQNELRRVSQITMQTLRFHRSSTRAARTDLAELTDTVLDLLHTRLRQQQIEVVRSFVGVPLVLAHEGEIRQLIANLLTNAIDALPAGGRILLRARSRTDSATGLPVVRYTVADNGTGVPPGLLGRIFEPFFSTKGITGTGLGLWISREIAGKHGGRLCVRSRIAAPGRRGGTTFTVILPIDGPR